MGICHAQRDTASTPMDRSVIAPSAALICSPAESSMSSSRGEGCSLISFAFCSRPSVVSPCAERTTTTSSPSSTRDLTMRAMRRRCA